MTKLAIVIALTAQLAFLSGCQEEARTVPLFDGERAYQYLEEQVAFGPRVPGTEPWRQCRTYFYEHFRRLGLGIDSQAFSFRDPYSGETLPLVNVIASIEGDGTTADRLVLMAHWDCRPRAEHAVDPAKRDSAIDGANDGASGVAVLMEMANLLSEHRPPCGVDLVLADGEDWGKPGHLDYYMLGSREFARRGIRDKYRFGLVVDLIGDKDQQIARERFSEEFHPELNDMVFGVAAELGTTTFIDVPGHWVHDDHMSLIAGGVPTINIIDFDYEYWHTEFDTPDKCSPQSLLNVGRVLAEVVYRPSLWPEDK